MKRLTLLITASLGAQEEEKKPIDSKEPVTFHRETRPDPMTSPGNIVQNDRLKTLDVDVSGNRVRAYKLTYGTSGTTSRLLLSSVAMYGTDAVLDGWASPRQSHIRAGGERVCTRRQPNAEMR